MKIINCRICNSSSLTEVVNLGNQYLASSFPKEKEKHLVPQEKVCLVMCDNCSLVQLQDTIKNTDMYESNNYGYKSSISNTMRIHLENYNSELQKLIPIEQHDWVLDIGSNDGTFLNYYPSCNKVGCDPTGNQFKQLYNEMYLIPTYFTYDNVRNAGIIQKFKIVTSIAMFYDLPNPIKFSKDIYDLLEDDGVWSFEMSYALFMINKYSLDTICHEHLEYYNIKNILDILNASSLKCIDLSFNESNGGSMRFKVSKLNSKYKEINLNEYLEKEIHLYNPNTYINWLDDCDKEINKTKDFINKVKNNKDKIYVYGASTKGNTLLQYAKLDSTIIDYAVERNLDKISKYTPGTNIPIISEDEMRKNQPKYMLVLPWHFKDEIVVRENDYLNKGGTLIFPLPLFTLVSKKNEFL